MLFENIYSKGPRTKTFNVQRRRKWMSQLREKERMKEMKKAYRFNEIASKEQILKL
jgi:hypothetical protein